MSSRAISAFKSGEVRILCATDVAARGIDVPQIEHVINFDLPMQDEDYVHRVGRTARNGAGGEAVSFVMPDEHVFWNKLAKKYQIPNVMLEVAGKRDGSAFAGANQNAKGGKKPRHKRGGNKPFRKNSRRERSSRSW